MGRGEKWEKTGGGEERNGGQKAQKNMKLNSCSYNSSLWLK